MNQKQISHSDLVLALTAFLVRELGNARPIGARLKFVYLEGGTISIDGSGDINKVTSEDIAADCTVTLASAVHASMLRFELNQSEAFRMGKMRVQGELGVALRLAPLLAHPFRLPGEAA
ncbi:MAG: SCP2 sterol-binding domain-containing protein [Parvibaculum sp.]